MDTEFTNLGHDASAAGHRDQATRHRHRTSKLFKKDHAYAACLVQIETTIRSVLRPAVTTNLPDRVLSEVKEYERIMTGISGNRGRTGAARRTSAR